MARRQLVEAELTLNSDDYTRSLRDASRTTERENDRMSDSVEEHADTVRDASQRTLRLNNETSRSYGVLRASTTADMERIRQATRNMSDTNGSATQDIIRNADRISDANDEVRNSSQRVNDAIRRYNQRISSSSSDTAGDIINDTSRIRTANDRLRQDTRRTADDTRDSTDDMAEGYEDLASRVEEASGKVAEVGKNIVGTVAGIATAVGTAGYVAYSNSEDATSKIQASLRVTREEAEKLEETASNLSFEGFEYEEAVNGLIAVKNALNGTLDEKQLIPFTEGALYLNKVFELDIADTVKATNSMMKNFGIDGAQSLDIITWGFQNGLDISKDFVDTLHEYAPQMKKLGFTAEETLQIINSGMEAGAFNTDKLLDGVKEFRLRLSDIDDTGAGALQKLGFSAETVQKEINKGGDSAKKMALKVSMALSNVKDDTERNALSIALFGTQFEDVGDAIYEGLNKAKTPIDDLVTSTESLVDAYKDNPAQKMAGLTAEIKRSFKDIGKDIMPYVLEVMEAIKDIVVYFTNLSPETKKTILVIMGIIGAFGVFLAVLGTFIGVCLAIGGAIATFSVWGPVAGIIIAVGALLTGIIAFIAGFSWDSFIEGGKKVFEFLGNVLSFIGQFKLMVVQAILLFVGSILFAIANLIYNIIMTIGVFFKNLILLIYANIASTVLVITSPFQIGFSVLKNLFEGTVEHIKLCIEFIKALFSGDFSQCAEIAKQMFENVKETGKNILQDAFNIIKNMIDKIKNLFKFDWSFPQLKAPEVTWTGGFSLNPVSVPKFDVKWHAKGGIYTRPTLFNTPSGLHGVGEAGAEAILPLDKLPQLLGLDNSKGDVVLNIKEFNNNTKQDIDQLSKEIAFSLRRKGVIA